MGRRHPGSERSVLFTRLGPVLFDGLVSARHGGRRERGGNRKGVKEMRQRAGDPRRPIGPMSHSEVVPSHC